MHTKQQHSSLHGKPFKAAHEDTISHWVKEVMAEAGIDVSKYNTHSEVSKYNTHSCRSAASTGAL